MTTHRLSDLYPQDIATIGDLPVTTLARTAVDLASTVTPGRLSAIVEEIVLGHGARIDAIGAVLDRVRRSGKPGVRSLENVLDVLGPGDAIPRSKLEQLLDAALDLSGLRGAIAEYPLPTTQLMKGFVDRCYPAAALIIEADGRKWHERRTSSNHDKERDLEAARSGFQTLRVTWESLSNDPEGMAAAFREVHAVRMAQLRRAS